MCRFVLTALRYLLREYFLAQLGALVQDYPLFQQELANHLLQTIRDVSDGYIQALQLCLVEK